MSMMLELRERVFLKIGQQKSRDQYIAVLITMCPSLPECVNLIACLCNFQDLSDM